MEAHRLGHYKCVKLYPSRGLAQCTLRVGQDVVASLGWTASVLGFCSSMKLV